MITINTMFVANLPACNQTKTCRFRGIENNKCLWATFRGNCILIIDKDETSINNCDVETAEIRVQTRHTLNFPKRQH